MGSIDKNEMKIIRQKNIEIKVRILPLTLIPVVSVYSKILNKSIKINLN
jgi:hypothetical protein